MDELSKLCISKVEALERSQGVVELSLDGKIIRANSLFLDLMGYEASEVVAHPHSIFVPPGQRNAADHLQLWQRLRRGEFTVGEFCRINKSKDLVWIHGVYCPLLAEDGQPYRILKFVSDISARKRQDADFAGQIAAIRRSQAVAEFDLDGRIRYANDKFLEIVGYRRHKIIGRHHATFVPEEQRGTAAYEDFWRRLRSGEYHTGTFRRIDSAGKTRWIQASYNPVRDENGQISKIVKFAVDQTEATEDHIRVDYLHRHDTLTELANRAGLNLAINAALEQGGGRRLSMLLVDLDRFKCINDTFGHAVGDQVLKTAAARIKEVVPGAVVVARLGGDEFAIVLDELADCQAAAAQIVSSVAEPIFLDGVVHKIGASVGISRHGASGSEMLRRADIALYAAKDAGRNTYRLFGESDAVETDLPKTAGACTF
ncbi:diguanylate cyclase [Rhodopseudomonas sp. HC1]|uniref:diguanylate cyclase domain-containing protein n=1 Tax=Rhodopseudomonas infernalis TaxID=2897386 RepID=UPI001EE92397|nr:diguanylate cyclase [Rhodopseudomonas infernalis]MCG6203191.1 diguanylate cyclase [Rhodopseudomonas infernalis]